MAKRFINPDWKRLRKLNKGQMQAWFYMWSMCDDAGVYEVDEAYFNIDLGFVMTIEELLKIPNTLLIAENKIYLTDFIKINYGILKEGYNPHKPAIRAIEKHGLQVEIEPIENLGKSMGAMRSRVSQKVRERIFLRDNMTCQYCSTQFEKEVLVIDHFKSIKSGGTSNDENLVTACIRCNSHKNDLSAEKFLSSKKEFLKATQYILNLIELDKNLSKLEEEDEDEEEEEEGKESLKGKPILTAEEEKFYPDKSLHTVDLSPDEMDMTISYLEVVCAKEFKTASVKNQWLAPPEIERQWKAFKIQYFNGETPYDNWGDVIQHFRDWLKNGVRKINQNGNKSTSGGSKSNKTGTSEARIAALREWGSTGTKPGT